jgi:hypothetical protein
VLHFVKLVRRAFPSRLLGNLMDSALDFKHLLVSNSLLIAKRSHLEF